MKRKVIGFVVLAIGVMLLLRAMGVCDFEWFFNCNWSAFMWPAIIIIIGIRLFFSGEHKHRVGDGMVGQAIPEREDGQIVKISASFSGNSYDFKGERFEGAKLNVFAGSIKIDLRRAVFEGDSVIDVQTLMGGVEILVPEGLRVLVDSSCLLGGVNRQTPSTDPVSPHVLLVNARCLMGGVDIKCREE